MPGRLGSQTQSGSGRLGSLNKEPVKDAQIRIVKLSSDSGGGEYQTSGPGTLHLTPKSQSAIKSKSGSERDHVVPYALGGTSSKDNLELKKNKIFAGRQEGKVKVEKEAIDEYQAGRISLPEARLKVMTKNQEIKGLIPKQGILNNLLPAVKDTFKSFIKGVGGGVKEITEQGKGLLHAAPRAATSVALDALNKNEFTPQSKITQTILGKEPIKSAQTEATETRKKVTDFAKKKGVNNELSQSLGLAVAPLFVGSMKGLDLTPLGGEKKVAEETAAKVLKSKGLVSKLRESLNPLRFQDKETKTIFKKYNQDILQAQEIANSQLPKLQKEGKTAFDNVLQYERGKPTPQSETIKKEFDTLYQESLKRGIDIGYRENYIPHVYNNTPEEVKSAMGKYMKDQGVDEQIIKQYLEEGKDLPDEVAKTLKLNPSFSKARVLPSYDTAIHYGLKPKYSEPSQLLAHSVYDLEKTTANKNLIADLEQSGKIFSRPEIGLEPVNLPFSTKGYFAKPELAKMLNGIFRNEDKLSFGQEMVKKTGELSRNIQNLVLSAGIPKTHVNFFTAGQLIKDLTAGNVSSIKAFARAFSNKASGTWFKENQKVLRDIADEGINLGDRVSNFQHIYKTLSDNKGVREKLGHVWHKSFDEKTFSSFMPQMYAETFKSVQKSALKKMNPLEARKLAGDTVKAFYGLMENVGRSKTTEDTLSSVFFAPRFREGIIRTLANTFKSVTTQIRNPAYSKNRKLVVGMLLSYAGYDALNKQLTGNHLIENPNGHEFELMIKRENGEVVYVPFMPSFLSVPRNIASGTLALGKGDIATFTNKMSQNLSIPLKTAGEILSNRDYFGNPIYAETDSPKEKLQKLAVYAGLSVNHPYVKEIYNTIAKDQPIHQTISKMLELPLKFSTMDKIQKAQMYEAMDKKKQERADAKDIFQSRYNEIRTLSETDPQQAQQILDSLSEEEYQLYKTMRSAEKASGTKKKKSLMYPTYLEIQNLKNEGRIDEASQMLDSLTDEEYKLYESLKKSIE